MTRITALVSLFLVWSLWLVPAAQCQEKLYRPEIAAKDIDTTLRTDWYGVYFMNKKIGYFRSNRNRQGSEIVDSILMHMKIVSMGRKTEMDLTQNLHFEGQAPYRLLRARFDLDNGPTKVRIGATRTDKGYEYQADIAGQKVTRAVADLDYVLADAMAHEGWLRASPKLGEQIVARDLDLQEWKMHTLRHKILSIKNSFVSGLEVKFFEIESENSKDMIKLLSRYDATGRMLSGVFAVFELRSETEEQAKNAEYSQDLFVLGMAKLDKGIGRTTNLSELILEYDSKEGQVFEPGPRQSVADGPGDFKRIKVGKAHGTPTKATAKEIEDALSETNAYAISNPRVKALAQEAIGDARTPEEKVKRIVAFAHNFVRPELSANIPNIHDLLVHKKGDCKSFALLVTNLCRASGVPARDVAGLVYMGDDQKAFGGHAWNEVVLNGVWVPVDASLGQTEVDAGHLCFGAESRATRNLLNSLGKLSFRLVEVKTK